MKIKYIVIFLFLSTINSNVQSQTTWSWAKKVTGQALANGLSKDTSGNLFLVGEGIFNLAFNTVSLTTGGTFLAKYNSSGTALWARGTPTYYANQGLSVSNDKFGNAYITGQYGGQTVFGSTTLTAVGNNLDAYVTKYDNNGNVIWAKSYGGVDNDTGNAITSDSLGNTFLVGTHQSGTMTIGSFTLNNPNISFSMPFLAKHSSNGNVIWAKNIITSGEGFATSVVVDKNGNSFLTGVITTTTASIGTQTLVGSGDDLFIAKFDPNGNVLWAKDYSEGYGQSITCDSQGNVYVTGSVEGPTLILGSYTLTNPGMADFFLTKLDQSGNVIWAKEGLNSSDAFGASVSLDKNNLFVTGGFFTTVLLDTFLFSSPSGSTRPLFVAKYDFNGNIVCGSVLSSGGGDGGKVLADGSGGAIVAGDFDTGSMMVGATNLNTTFSWSPFIAHYFCSSTIGINELSINNNFKIYPNPNNGNFKIDNSEHSKSVTIKIFNTIGQEVHEQILEDGENNILTKNLSKGLYNYVLFESNQKIESGKLIFE